jgi:hypothetical protein
MKKFLKVFGIIICVVVIIYAYFYFFSGLIFKESLKHLDGGDSEAYIIPSMVDATTPQSKMQPNYTVTADYQNVEITLPTSAYNKVSNNFEYQGDKSVLVLPSAARYLLEQPYSPLAQIVASSGQIDAISNSSQNSNINLVKISLESTPNNLGFFTLRSKALQEYSYLMMKMLILGDAKSVQLISAGNWQGYETQLSDTASSSNVILYDASNNEVELLFKNVPDQKEINFIVDSLRLK